MVTECGPEETRADCKARLLRLLNARERCVSELRLRLKADGYPADIVDELLAWSVACNLVSDQRFAEAYIMGKKNLGWGRERIERELRSRDIEPCSLDGYPDSFFDDDDELERALAQARLVTHTKGDRRQTIYRRLLSKGFSSSIASRVAADLASS